MPFLTIGDRLTAVMRSRNLTVESLALESGYSEKYIHEIRSNKKTNPTIKCVECLAQVLQVNPEFLAGWDNDT